MELTVTGLTPNLTNVLTEHFRIDATHSNSYAAWKAVGSPQNPSESQYRELEADGRLQFRISPAWIRADRGTVTLKFNLPRQALSLFRLAW